MSAHPTETRRSSASPSVGKKRTSGRYPMNEFGQPSVRTSGFPNRFVRAHALNGSRSQFCCPSGYPATVSDPAGSAEIVQGRQ